MHSQVPHIHDRTQVSRKAKNRKKIKLFMMILPLLILLLAFNYVPLFGWYMAFVHYIPGVSFFHQQSSGIEAFILLFYPGSPIFNALKNTLILSLLGLLTSPLPAIFAIMLTELRSRKFSKIVQTFSTMPNFFSWIIVYAVFFAMFSSQDGILNIILERLSIIKQPTNILINSQYAWLIQTCIGVYKNVGFSAILYIAAIAGIDQELFDAAQVDGAGRFRCIWHVTVPGLLPTFIVLFILSLGSLLTAGGFDQYWVFNNPIVFNKIDVIDTYTYRVGIQQNNYSIATAAGMLKSIISITLVFLSNRMSKVVLGRSII